MRIRIPYNIFYQILFVLCILAPYFDSYELTFAVWSLSACITVATTYSLTILKQIACYGAILLIACIATFQHDYKMYNIIRDVTYLLKPILGLLIGYQLSKKFNGNIFRLIIVTGVL